MLNKVKRYISQNDLLQSNGKYIVALSGGADSVALLLMMQEMHYDVEAAHCNFHLRGEESERDEEFVRKLCDKLDIPLHVVSFDTKAYSRSHKISIEMAARELRYEYFEHLRNELNADAICVAHHKDDLAETVLINLIRGTGINGLAGIKPKNGNVVRPLLCLSREDILSYLNERNQTFVTDSSNLMDNVVRNKLRLNIIPMLKDINPAFVDNVVRTADNIRESLNDSDENELFRLLNGFGFNGKQVRQIAGTSESGRMYSSGKFDLLVDRDTYIIRKHINESPVDLGSLKIEEAEIDTSFIVPKLKDVAYVDADLVAQPISMRRIQTGDKFVPFGMKGKKLLSDFLTDIKMPLLDKQNQLVVVDAEGRIVWVVNQRTDNRFRVTDKTKRVLILRKD